MFPPQMTSTVMERLLLLACLCLLTLSGVTFGHESDPPIITMSVQEGSDVILPCSLSTKKNIIQMLFDWKKNDHKEVFMYDAGVHYNNGRLGQDEQFKGRVSHFPQELKHGNASIIITDTKVADSGNYTCIFPRLQPQSQTFHIRLVVGAAPEPYVTTLDQTKDWALLQCVVRGAFPEPLVTWKDSTNATVPSEEPQVSEREGRFYITLQTTVTKTDRYRCVTRQEEIGHQIHSEIFVHLSGSASKPAIIILNETKDGVLLKCEVHGASPKPKVVWKDSVGNVLLAKQQQVTERGGSYDIILKTMVTKTDHYRCVVTQEEINHVTATETYVPVHVSDFTGWVVAAVVSVVLVGVLVSVAVHKAKRYNCKKDSPRETSLSSNSAQKPDHDSKQPLNG